MSKYLKLTISTLLIISIFLSGCTTIRSWFGYDTKKIDYITPTSMTVQVEKIEDITKNLSTNNNDIKSLSTNIFENADKVEKSNPNIIEIPQIKTDATKIGFINEDSIKNVKNLAVVKIQLDKASEQIENLKKENEKYKSEIYAAARKLWIGIMSLASFGLVASIFMLVYGNVGRGMLMFVASLSTIALSIFMSIYIVYIAIGGGILSVVVLGFYIHEAYINRKALKESVTSMELSKYADWNDTTKQQIKDVQSTTTQKLVGVIREDLKKTGLVSVIKNQANQVNQVNQVNSDSQLTDIVTTLSKQVEEIKEKLETK